MLKRLVSSFAFIIFILLWIEFLSKTRPIFVNDYIFGNWDLTKIGWIFFACIVAPITEELVFRKAPLDFARKFYKQTGFDYSMEVAIMTSFIFGYIHTNAIPYNILLQGLGGFLLSILYIKNDYKYWYNVLAHAGWNLGVTFVLPFVEKIT